MTQYNFTSLYARLDKSIDLITQFCDLVEDCYKSDLNLNDFKLNPWDIIFNNMAYPVIIMSKQEVVGGAILYIRPLGDSQKLPLEKSTKIRLEDIINDNHLSISNNICEISTMAVKEKYRDRRITQEILGVILAKATKEHCDLMFAITTKHTSRNFKLIYNKLGITYTTLKSTLPSNPMYPGLTIDLAYANFRNFNLTKLLTNCHFAKLITEMYDISSSIQSHRITAPKLNPFMDKRIC